MQHNAKKARFAIVGSGWRAAFYVRIAKAFPEQFELLYMLCRTSEKAERLAKELDIPTTTKIQDCIDAKPDFVVVAVTKSSMTDVALEWVERGFFVLAETPAALNLETIEKLKSLGEKGNRLVIAEQFHLYPEYSAILSLLKKDLIGEPTTLNISLAHEYHAASLIRMILRIPIDMKFSVHAKTYEFPTTETLTRYERFTDGRIANKKRTAATFEFENGKVAFYDFDSEQYRSPIRKNTLKIQGVRGEIIDRKVYYLDEKNEAQEMDIAFETTELTQKAAAKKLSQDETAIATLMQKMSAYTQGTVANPYPLEEAIQDSYMAIQMLQSVRKGKSILE